MRPRRSGARGALRAALVCLVATSAPARALEGRPASRRCAPDAPRANGARNAQQRAAPTGGGPAAVARGRASFDRVCGRCHPHGNEDVGARLIGLGWPEARVRTQVRHGRRTMRAIPATRLSDAELDDVIAYLRTIHAVQ